MSDIASCPRPLCTTNCRLVEHGQSIYAIATKGTDTEVINLWMKTCANFAHVKTDFGRSAIHAASATGRFKIARWLIRNYGVNVNLRESRNGYSPLYISLFFGHIHVAAELIRLGANFQHSPLDLIIKHIPLSKERSKAYEVYICGENGNFTLGLGKESGRSAPQLLDTVRFQNEDGFVVLSAYHSVFVPGGVGVVTSTGTGPRLGIESQCVMLPGPVVFDGRTRVHCVGVATGPHHTIFLMKDGSVWSCGGNKNSVLGHDLPPSANGTQTTPKRIQSLDSKFITHVAASSFHSVFATDVNTVYACGVNLGQFGSSVGIVEQVIIQPRKIFPTLARRVQESSSRKIQHMSCNEYATVIAWENELGLDVFYQNLYQRVLVPSGDYTSRAGVLKTEVIGGNSEAADAFLNSRGGKSRKKPLMVFILVEDGNTRGVWIYQELGIRRISSLNFKYVHPINVIDMTVSLTEILVLTTDGEGFCGPIDTIRGDPQLTITVRRIQNIQRGLKITCSRSTDSSFAVFQWRYDGLACEEQKTTPTERLERDLSNLLKDATLCDHLHDVEFVIKEQVFPAHRFILSVTAPRLYSLVRSASDTDCNVPVKVDLPNVTPDVFQCALRHAYCDAVDAEPSWIDDPTSAPSEIIQWWNTFIGEEPRSSSFGTYPITTRTSQSEFLSPDGDDLTDAIIVCIEGSEFPVHRVMLASRLKYFKIQYASSAWSKRMSGMSVINIPFQPATVSYLLNYVYHPHHLHPDSFDGLLLEELIQIDKMADMLCCDELRDLVATELRRLTTNRTVIEFMKIYQMLNLPSLEEYCMEFLLQNLRYQMENGFLVTYEDDLLSSLAAEYWRRFFTIYTGRVVRPSVEPPSDDAYAAANEPMTKSILDNGTLPPSLLEEKLRKELKNSSRKTKKSKSSTIKQLSHPSRSKKLTEPNLSTERSIQSSSTSYLLPTMTCFFEENSIQEDDNMEQVNQSQQLLPNPARVARTSILEFPTLEITIRPKSAQSQASPSRRCVTLSKGKKMKWKPFELSTEPGQEQPKGLEPIPPPVEPPKNPWKVEDLQNIVRVPLLVSDEAEVVPRPPANNYSSAASLPRGKKMKWKSLEFPVASVQGQPEVIKPMPPPVEPPRNPWKVDDLQKVMSLRVSEKAEVVPLPKSYSSAARLPKGKKIKWKPLVFPEECDDF